MYVCDNLLSIASNSSKVRTVWANRHNCYGPGFDLSCTAKSIYCWLPISAWFVYWAGMSLAVPMCTCTSGRAWPSDRVHLGDKNTLDGARIGLRDCVRACVCLQKWVCANQRIWLSVCTHALTHCCCNDSARSDRVFVCFRFSKRTSQRDYLAVRNH